MGDDDALRSTIEELKALQDDEVPEADKAEEESPKPVEKSSHSGSGGSLLDDLMRETNPLVDAEVQEVKATLRDREHAGTEAKRQEQERRRQELENLRLNESNRREEMIRERQRKKALQAMAAANDSLNEELAEAPPPSRRGTITVVAVILLALGGGVAWWAMDKTPSPSPPTTSGNENAVQSEAGSTQGDENTSARSQWPRREGESQLMSQAKRGLETTIAAQVIPDEAPAKTIRKPRRSRHKRARASKKKKAKKQEKKRRRFPRMRLPGTKSL
jgi:hypothetical protein